MLNYRLSMAEIAERIAINWIECVVTPPAKLATIVGRYRDLTFYCTTEDSPAIDRAMNTLYDYLVVAAERDYRAKLASQFFTISRPVVPLQRQWDEAIDQWRRRAA
jgi:hypothetical protein